ncbi:MAG: hypothetical protein EHM21_19415, partial [Chloroflexi bacterium]
MKPGLTEQPGLAFQPLTVRAFDRPLGAAAGVEGEGASAWAKLKTTVAQTECILAKGVGLAADLCRERGSRCALRGEQGKPCQFGRQFG